MVIVSKHQEPILDKAQLNADIAKFPQVIRLQKICISSTKGFPFVMIDRYSFKDTEKKTLKVGDFVVLTVKEDPKFPARGLWFMTALDEKMEKQIFGLKRLPFCELVILQAGKEEIEARPIEVLEKPLEVFYEQIAKRNATGLASVETTEARRQESFDQFL